VTVTATVSPTETATETQTPIATPTQTPTATGTPIDTPTSAPRIRVSPTNVTLGQEVTVSVTGFGTNEAVRVRWLVEERWIEVGTLTTDVQGSGSMSVLAPLTAGEGAAKVRGDSTTHAAQTGAVTVIAPLPPSVTLSALRVSVGQTVGITVADFPAETTLSVSWRRPGGSTVALGSLATDAAGAAGGAFTVPATEGGPDSQVIVGAPGGVSVSMKMEVAPRIAVSPSTVTAGQAVTVSLRGYGKGEMVQIRWLVDGRWVPVGIVTTSNTGSASITITVPLDAPIGPSAVRGDGPVFRQQTNAVSVVP
jgi:hypothetical protein